MTPLPPRPLATSRLGGSAGTQPNSTKTSCYFSGESLASELRSLRDLRSAGRSVQPAGAVALRPPPAARVPGVRRGPPARAGRTRALDLALRKRTRLTPNPPRRLLAWPAHLGIGIRVDIRAWFRAVSRAVTPPVRLLARRVFPRHPSSVPRRGSRGLRAVRRTSCRARVRWRNTVSRAPGVAWAAPPRGAAGCV